MMYNIKNLLIDIGGTSIEGEEDLEIIRSTYNINKFSLLRGKSDNDVR